eukprot:4355477-Pleurochrysis_carterae.AAC.3
MPHDGSRSRGRASLDLSRSAESLFPWRRLCAHSVYARDIDGDSGFKGWQRAEMRHPVELPTLRSFTRGPPD